MAITLTKYIPLGCVEEILMHMSAAVASTTRESIFKRVFSFLCLLFILIISQAIAKPEYQYTLCMTTDSDYTPNSTYQTNLRTLLSRLTSNTNIDYGFYNSSYGQDSDTVYATGLCRGDVTLDTCRSCLNNSISLLQERCPHQKEAVGGYDKCMLHYADRSIFGYDDSSFWVYLRSETIVTDWDQYSYVLINLLSSLRVKAATSDSNPNLKFATGNATGPSFQSVYALVQCSPDLTKAQCNDCLVGAFSEISTCCNNFTGGGVIKSSCNFRYQNSRFDKPMADALTLSLSPQPQGSPSTTTSSLHSIDHGKGNKSHAVIAKVMPAVAFVAMVILICIYLRVRKATKHFEIPNQEEVEVDNEVRHGESTQFNFDTIRVATNNFSYANKLGQGGFGPVYKGRLSNEQEIAVKRLSENSGQGDMQFKNEVVLMTRLQHRNLVRLLGFCIEGKERLLVYEFLTNKSLDYFLFDPIKRADLDWKTRYKIIEGIARGLLYLHEDSQQRVIHLDLKPSNILLDAYMKPKIADFGLSRLFVVDQTQAYASKISGTLGYMAPEYAMHGKFSVKSDVFSFGVMILQIVSGQKNSGFRNGENVEHLLSLAWKSLRKGTASNIIDPTINDGSRNEIVRCIHIGLLCVQERVADRPTLASVVLMLNNHSFYLPLPMKPAFFFSGGCLTDIQFSDSSSEATGSSEQKCSNSVNEASISSLYPR